MTAPAGTTKLDQARVELHRALVDVMAACGWPAERAHPLPPRQIVSPTGWVDAPRLQDVSTEGARALTATFPVAVALDGADREQVQQLDKLLAHGWTALEAVKVPGDRPGASHTARVLTAGPEFLDVGGIETRAVVFSVRLTLHVRTLCSGPATPSDEASTAP